MDCQYLPLSATGQFSRFFLDYIAQQPDLTPFYHRFPTATDSFADQRAERTFSDGHRQTLTDALTRQYADIGNPPANIALLRQGNTFTVTTGHQLNIFTGPLYVIYKLVTVINLAHQLRATYPDYNFVPVYWMATEDHDFAEINHATLFGQTYAWQTNQRGAVGRLNPHGLTEVLAQIPEKIPYFPEAYGQHETLADAVRFYIHALFGAEGLVCLDADDPALKALFRPVIHDELTQQTAHRLVTESSARLQTLGYEPVITPREINLFYLTDGLRERIVFEDGQYRVLNTTLTFSPDEIGKLVNESPERFSPNVVLRPVYQETILPNLAYIGGPSEVPYWLQLKAVFDYHALPFPLLLPRNFAMYVPTVTARRMDRLGLTPEDLFEDDTRLKHDFIDHHTRHSLKLDGENKTINRALDAILHKATQVDPTLEKAVLAETKRFANAVIRLEKKMRRAEERNQETGIRQLLAVKHELFPNGGSQERSENFLTFYLRDPDFLNHLLLAFDPLDFRYLICRE
jgi:bacillithiol synthase